MKVLFEKAKAKNARVQMSEAFITSVFLALSGGFQDAYTYFTRDEVFSNAQTGNVVLMSQHFMLGEWQRGLHYLIPLLAFAGGVFFADCVQGKFKYANRLHWRQGILLLEILILFGVGFIPQDYNMLATTLVSFSCAMQVQSFRKVGGYSYASTMCIGNLRSGTAALSAYMRDRPGRRCIILGLSCFLQWEQESVEICLCGLDLRQSGFQVLFWQSAFC